MAHRLTYTQSENGENRTSRHFTPRATYGDWRWGEEEEETGAGVECGAHSFLSSFLPSFSLYLATPPPHLGLVAAAVATLASLHFPPLSLIAIQNPIPLPCLLVLDSAHSVRMPDAEPVVMLFYACGVEWNCCHLETAKKKSSRRRETERSTLDMNVPRRRSLSVNVV